MNKLYHAFGYVLFAATVFGGPSAPPAASVLSVPLATVDDGTTWNVASRVTLGTGRVIYPSAQGRVDPANGFIELGYHRQTVLFVLGDPAQKLNDNLWVYRGFRSDAPSARGLDTLVLHFENERLTAFKLVDEKTLKAAVALFNRTHTRARSAAVVTQ